MEPVPVREVLSIEIEVTEKVGGGGGGGVDVG